MVFPSNGNNFKWSWISTFINLKKMPYYIIDRKINIIYNMSNICSKLHIITYIQIQIMNKSLKNVTKCSLWLSLSKEIMNNYCCFLPIIFWYTCKEYALFVHFKKVKESTTMFSASLPVAITIASPQTCLLLSSQCLNITLIIS